MKPPHLPRETCNIKQHDQINRIKILLVAVFFGVLAGATGAIMVLGWIWPNTEIGNTWIVSQNRNNETSTQLESQVVKEFNEKIYAVYEKSTAIGQNGFGLDNKIGEAVSVSSDGWLVMYVPVGFTQIEAKKWLAISRDGVVFKINDFSFDPFGRFVYLKISPLNEKNNDLTQYKVIGFYQDEVVDLEVFSYNGSNWQADFLSGRKKTILEDNHLDSVFNQAYVLNEGFTVGQPIINKRGWLVGFVMEGNMILPIKVISEVLPQVLSGQKIKYPSLGVVGWFSEEKPIIVNGEIMTGFIVSKVWNAKTLLKKNDIIMEINGMVVQSNLNFFDFGTEPKNLKIWRDGKILEIKVQPVFALSIDFNNI